MKNEKKTVNEKKVLSYRRTCKQNAKGTGLSHYIFIDNSGSKKNR